MAELEEVVLPSFPSSDFKKKIETRALTELPHLPMWKRQNLSFILHFENYCT